MMDKNKYLNKLEARLDRLPLDKLEKVMQQYEKYFDDAGEENELDVIDELGSPKELANSILDDYYFDNLMEEDGKEPSGSKRGLVLGLTFYIWIPLIALVFLFDIVLVCVGGLLVISGVFVIISGIVSMFSSLSTGAFFMGAGLVMSAIGILVFIAGIVLFKLSRNFVLGLFGRSKRSEGYE